MERNTVTSKQSIRNKYLGCRNSLTTKERKEKSSMIWGRLKAESVFEQAEVVLVYMDYRSEVMTTMLVEELLLAKEKRVYAPRVEGMDITFYEITSLEDLEAGYQGIREPENTSDRAVFTEEICENENCLVLVPGAVFDREKYRMGYGKGFYDRFLAKYSELTSAALAFECQIARKVPAEPHDKKVDMIITENEVIK